MSETEQTGAQEIRADIEQTRAELAGTVDALTDKLNVKARAGDKAAAAKAKVPEQIRPYGKQILLAAAASAIVLLILRKKRSA